MNKAWLDNAVSWAADLKFEDIPTDVVEEAKNQIFSTLSAIQLGRQSEEGRKISLSFGLSGEDGIAEVLKRSPKEAASVMASWSMVHDFDDVMLGGHTGHSTVIVPLVLALSSGSGSAEEIITAQVTANEIAARINIACALGQTRGQMASHLHLVATAIARAKFLGMGREMLRKSIIFSLSSTGKQSLPAFLGSDAKFFCASTAIRSGWESCDIALSGLYPSDNILFGRAGFFETMVPYCRPELIDNIGSEWFTLTNSIKIYPSCGYISSTIDCVYMLMSKGGIDSADIDSVEIKTNIFNYGVEKLSQLYLKNSTVKSVSSLTFCPTYIVASTLVYGKFTVDNLRKDSVEDPAVWALMKKISLKYDAKHSAASLMTGVPVGIVLSNAPFTKAFGFISKLSGLVFSGESRLKLWFYRMLLFYSWWTSKKESFNDISELKKKLPSTVKITMNDGVIHVAEQSIPRGFLGNSDWLEKRRYLHEKYRSGMGSISSKERIESNIAIIDDFQHRSIDSLFNLLHIE
ncbi:MAG: hypothetical protein COA42_23470 [Alteromonadaceae bacterium]|nr:MAG: hypothetical protein COA42_23470 [Alteromonadaceae bacterium]